MYSGSAKWAIFRVMDSLGCLLAHVDWNNANANANAPNLKSKSHVRFKGGWWKSISAFLPGPNRSWKPGCPPDVTSGLESINHTPHPPTNQHNHSCGCPWQEDCSTSKKGILLFFCFFLLLSRIQENIFLPSERKREELCLQSELVERQTSVCIHFTYLRYSFASFASLSFRNACLQKLLLLINP